MPDLTLGFELAQSLQRHYAVDVLLREGCVDMQVVYANIACCCASSKNSIRWIRGPRIPPLNVLVERLVGLEGNAAKLTIETVHWDIGLTRGLQGICRGGPSVAQCFIIRPVMPSRKR